MELEFPRGTVNGPAIRHVLDRQEDERGNQFLPYDLGGRVLKVKQPTGRFKAGFLVMTERLIKYIEDNHGIFSYKEAGSFCVQAVDNDGQKEPSWARQYLNIWVAAKPLPSNWTFDDLIIWRDSFHFMPRIGNGSTPFEEDFVRRIESGSGSNKGVVDQTALFAHGLYACTCPSFLQHSVCVHMLGQAIQMGVISFPNLDRAGILGRPARRGSPPRIPVAHGAKKGKPQGKAVALAKADEDEKKLLAQLEAVRKTKRRLTASSTTKTKSRKKNKTKA